MMKLSTTVTAVLAGIMLLAVSGVGEAQEIEPRIYANIPVGMNFLAVGYSYSSGNVSGNVFMDPALPIENLDAGLNIVFARYIRSFNLFGAPAKFKAVLPWSSGHWDGILEGEFRTRDTSGFADAKEWWSDWVSTSSLRPGSTTHEATRCLRIRFSSPR